ncbi:hypothetical protein [Actinoplanes xinjiangensis]|uniref:Uncharacterized protein n=1 Tax=Actinoplanes xinjiangensis TaxID=512350 RepID=A0A316F889_9ACTN|nr:hypothetical protein [Actinoplanes xinjiangensis]PWK33285.1 hypothetical protein BC793_12875 [Actinoplanes xinjiangensis]GIF43476.1 hypothetical protein Axi01nite_77870 [Actinoplanes xinjiangensis]
MNPAALRAALGSLLQEPDPHRHLDSLEVVVIRAHLTEHGLPADGPAEDRPRTIEGWVTWAVRHSRAS